MMPMFNNTRQVLRATVIVVFLVVLGGCATHGSGVKSALTDVERGNFPAAIQGMKKILKPEGKDRLLYFLELGLLKSLDGQYEASNRDLTQAAQIAEDLETKRASDLLKEMLTSPRQASYSGSLPERVYIHYYKALNYISLALEDPSQKVEYLEGARIEARKIDIVLTALKNETGTYDEIEDKKGQLFSKLLDIFEKLDGNFLDEDMLVYREDAYVRYLAGVVYETNGEYDDARVSYQQAATLYEKGYEKQYTLGSPITEQAWFDAIRMMKWGGGYDGEWQRLAEKKLSAEARAELDSFNRKSAQLLVIEHAGMIPQREELNVKLYLDEGSKEIVLTPYLTGTASEQQDQFSWFYAMYAEKGFLSMISNYRARGPVGVALGKYSKRIGLGPAWELLESSGAKKAIGAMGLRVTVPYYRPYTPSFGTSELWVDGNSYGALKEAESLSNIALQGQLLDAGGDLKKAVARELVKAIIAEGVVKGVGGAADSVVAGLSGFIDLGTKILNAVTSQAETRNWLTLPAQVRIKRIPLQPGAHDVRIVTSNASHPGVYKEQLRSMSLSEGQIRVLRIRTTRLGG